jgi:hypothetical protein
MFVCCVLSGRGLCDELITRPRGVLPTVARRVWSRNLVWRRDHSPRWAAEPGKQQYELFVLNVIFRGHVRPSVYDFVLAPQPSKFFHSIGIFSLKVLKLSRQQNPIKFSLAESRIKMWRFSDVSGTNSDPHLQGVLVVWQYQNWWLGVLPWAICISNRLGAWRNATH